MRQNAEEYRSGRTEIQTCDTPILPCGILLCRAGFAPDPELFSPDLRSPFMKAIEGAPNPWPRRTTNWWFAASSVTRSPGNSWWRGTLRSEEHTELQSPY